jgi:hypothetical protein
MVSASPAVFHVEKWRMVEIPLTSARVHTDPFSTVTVTAIFNHGKVEITRPAFWDGENRWKIRFAPPAIGDWRFQTICSDPQDTGLQGQQGVIHAAPYKGSLLIFKHGFLKSSPDHRYFTYADGTPFFYLGDTHWEAMHERFNTSNAPGCASQFKCEVDKRVSQGFTVYQSEWMAGGLPNPNEPVYDWDNGITDPDMPGFQNADRKFQYLTDHGLVVANAMNWRGLIPKYSDDYLKKLGRYWAARYGAFPVLWTMGQETDGIYPDDPPNLDEKWQVVAQALSENDEYHQPLSAHMCNSGTVTASTSLWRQKPYHTWYAAQVQGDPLPISCALDFWDSTPTKPSILYEPPYENFWTDEAGERIRAYVAFLSGFYGFGYGVAGVWDDNYTCEPVRDSGTTYDPHCKLWYDGLNRPSGDQMTLFRRFFTSLEWWKLKPRFASAEWRMFLHPSEARMASDEWKTYAAIFYNKTTDTGLLKRMNKYTTYNARWYNPRTGKYTLIGRDVSPNTAGEWNVPPKPDQSDWILLVQANNPKAAPPHFPAASAILDGFWPLDGGIEDVSHHTGPANLVGGSYSVDSNGEYVSLPGKDSYIDIPNGNTLDGMNQLTVCIRMRLNALPASNAAIVNKEFSYRLSVDAHGGWHFEVATEGSPWYSAGTVASSSKAIPVGKWVQLTGTYDGQTIKVYTDGEICGESQPIIAGRVAHNASIVDVGKANKVNMDALNADLSDMRIYSSALSSAQMKELYSQAK